MLNIISSLSGLATSYIDGKTAVKKAEAETKMKIATGEISWEQSAIEASKDSWKDEAWTILFIAVIVGCFVPGLQVHIEQGFYVLSNSTPEWFQYAVYMSIAASFGVRGLKRFTK